MVGHLLHGTAPFGLTSATHFIIHLNTSCLFIFLPLNLLFIPFHPFFSSHKGIQQGVSVCVRVNTSGETVCVCMLVCIWIGSNNHSDSGDVPLMLCLLTSALVFVLPSSFSLPPPLSPPPSSPPPPLFFPPFAPKIFNFLHFSYPPPPPMYICPKCLFTTFTSLHFSQFGLTQRWVCCF